MLFDVVARVGRCSPGRFEQRQLVAHVRDLGGIGDARGFDLQNRDLIDQFAGGDGYVDFAAHVSVSIVRRWGEHRRLAFAASTLRLR